LTADNSVFPYSNANDMRVTQDLNSFGEIIAHAHCSVDEKKLKYIPCVPHKNNCQKKNWFTRHETDIFLNNHSQECVRAYLSIHDCSRGHDRQSSDQNFSSRGHDQQSSEQNNRTLISLHNNSEDDKHARGFADF
jgi:hypothetical protein